MNAETGNSLLSMLPMLGIIVVFFLILIIPQRKRDKKMKEMLSNIHNGDKIRTIGGIYGIIVKRSEETVTIELVPSKTRMMIARTAIASVEKKANEPDDDDEPEQIEETASDSKE